MPSIALLTSGLAFVSASYSVPLANPAIVPAAPTYELCFEGTHTRCIRYKDGTLADHQGNGIELSNPMNAEKARELKKSIASFMKKISYAVEPRSKKDGRKLLSCRRPLRFHPNLTSSIEELRCIEMIKKKDAKDLGVLLDQVALAVGADKL